MKIAKRPKELTETEAEAKCIQRLASQITTQAIWDQVLANATSPGVREELETKIGPRLPFRRAAPCSSPECESGKQATWTPVLACRNGVDTDDVTHVSIELKLCDECKEDASLADFLTEDIWSQILAAWDYDEIPPARDRTTLQWERAH